MPGGCGKVRLGWGSMRHFPSPGPRLQPLAAPPEGWGPTEPAWELGSLSPKPIRVPQPWEGVRSRAQAERGGRVQSPGARGPGAQSLHGPVCPQNPFAPGLRFARHPVPQCPPPGSPNRTDVQILAAPGWVPRICSDHPAPDHQISSWTRVGGVLASRRERGF